MTQLLRSNQWRSFDISRVLKSVFYSSVARPSSSSFLPNETLYQKIWRSGDPKISLTALLQQWVEQGRNIKQPDLQRIIKQLRKHRRYSQALQVSEWMSDGLNYDLPCGDIAVRLDLISKVRGLAQAEEYFNSIPILSRDDKVHGALLNCYAEKDSLVKAEELFNKIRESGFVKLSLSYNVMLSMYSRMGKHDKLLTLVQEMEENGIKSDVFTYTIRLNAFAVTSDIEAMERLLAEMEADPQVTVDFHAYFVTAKGYLRANLLEKALIALGKAEKLIYCNGKRDHYEHLITLYAAAGKKDEVYRVWYRYKSLGKIPNKGYLSLLSSLVRLDDIDGVEKIFTEWESGRPIFDNRIANLLISAYCKKGFFEKAFAYVQRLLSDGRELDSSIWQCLANQCCTEGQMQKAVEFMKKAASANGRLCKFNRFTLAACLEYLKQEGDLGTAHEILELLRERGGSFSSEIYSSLVDYINGNLDCGALEAMKGYNQKEENHVSAEEKNE